jgi:hypothetical protein
VKVFAIYSTRSHEFCGVEILGESRLGGKVSVFSKLLDKVKYSNPSKLEKQQLQLHL